MHMITLHSTHALENVLFVKGITMNKYYYKPVNCRPEPCTFSQHISRTQEMTSYFSFHVDLDTRGGEPAVFMIVAWKAEKGA